MVGGLREKQPRQSYPESLATGQRGDALADVVAGEQEAGEIRPHALRVRGRYRLEHAFDDGHAFIEVIEALRKVPNPVGVRHQPGIRLRFGMPQGFQQPRFAGSIPADQRDPLRPEHKVGRAVGGAPLENAAAGRHIRVGEIDPDALLPPHAGLPGFQGPLGVFDGPLVLAAEFSGGDLRFAAPQIHDYLRPPFIAVVGLRVRLSAGELRLGLDALALFRVQRLFGGAHRLFGRGLLPGEVLAVFAIGTTEHGDRVIPQFGDGIHAFQQFGVMADDDEGAFPTVDDVPEPEPCFTIQVIRRLVENRDGRPRQFDADEGGEHHLSARERADGVAQSDSRQAGGIEECPRPGPDVPIVADHLEMFGCRVPVFDGGQGIEFSFDTQQLGHSRLRVEDELLRKVRHVTGAGDGARGGYEITQNQPDQRGLAGSVIADEPGPADADYRIGGMEDFGAVGPGE